MCANVLPAGCSISKDSVNEDLLERGGKESQTVITHY
jgi:hypothetical protein